MPSRSGPPAAAADGSDRGKRATFDHETGEVSGSGSGAGDPGVGDEDYDDDLSTGSGGDRKEGEPSNAA
jgi:hypothetical protein